MPDSNKIIDRKWSDAEVRRLYEKLSLDSRMGKPARFEIKVDDLAVIPRTEDLTLFYSFMGFVDPAVTDTVEIKLFKGKGWSCDIWRLHLERETETLSAPVVQTSVDDFQMKLELERKERKHEREMMERGMEMRDLKRDHEALVKEFAELSDYADKLEEEVKEYRGKNLNVGPFHLGEVGSVMLESFIKRNPAMLGGLGKAPTPPLESLPDDFDFEEQAMLPIEWSEAVQTALSLPVVQQAGLLRVLETLAVEPAKLDTILQHL